MINSLIRQTTTLAIAAAATLVTIVASASPASAAEAPQLRVDISGYDLASDSGQAKAAAVLRRAANRVCDIGDTRSLAGIAATRACTQQALAGVMPRLETMVAAARDGRTDVAVNDVRDNRADTSREVAPVRR
jgi:UrcA family protein